jgi:hypothetical protein
MYQKGRAIRRQLMGDAMADRMAQTVYDDPIMEKFGDYACDMPPPGSGCGIIGCASSPYLRARGGPALVGQPVMQAVAVMGGAPTGQFQVDAQTQVLTWQRQQHDADFGAMVHYVERLEVVA